MLIRLNTDGTLDTSFGTSGVFEYNYLDSGGMDDLRRVLVQYDGSILVAGATGGNDYHLSKLDSSGTLDTSFDPAESDGIVMEDTLVGIPTGLSAHQLNIATQCDNKIILIGTAAATPGPNGDFLVIRYNTDGSRDTTFNSGGAVPSEVYTDIGGNADYANAVSIQSDGKILVAGSSDANGNDDFAIVRYNDF